MTTSHYVYATETQQAVRKELHHFQILKVGSANSRHKL